MNLPEICIRRTVFATVLSLVITLLGLISYQRLPVREYPNIDEPLITVTTGYSGASAEIVESQVTRPLEESLAGIEGIDLLSSISRPERSQITVKFKLTRDPDLAAGDVRDRVARIRRELPDEIDEPVIAKVEADAQPIMYLAFSSDRHSPLEVSDFADRYVKDQLQTLPGVADVQIFGERRYAMRIWLDRRRAHREQPARIHRAERDRPAHARAVRSDDFARCKWLSRAPSRCRPHRDRRRGRAADSALQRPHRRRTGHRQAGDRESARNLQRSARGLA